MKVEVAVLGSPSLASLMVSMDIKQHCNGEKKKATCHCNRHPAVSVAVADHRSAAYAGNSTQPTSIWQCK